MELGISTFGEIHPDGTSGNAVNAHKRVQELLEEVKLADEVGLDVYAFGEHHRPDFVISAPEILISAAAAITKNIRLSSSVTVLSSVDPVRTFQNFATADLVSGGRVEMIAGRGSFIESFPLFGFDLNDYDALFTEKLEMFLQINKQEIVSWQGNFRAPIRNQGVYPRPLQQEIPVWIGVGGTPASAKRAGALNLPMIIAILGSAPKHFVPFVELYRESAAKAGHDVSKLQLAISSQFYIAGTSQQAADEFYPSYEALMTRVGKDRGWSPMTREQFEYLRDFGPLVVGDPQQAIDKIMQQYELFGNTRFVAQLVTGFTKHKDILKTIELYGTRVAPVVRKETKAKA
ncbi:LLM class flavin-dependent oxidoreductase [Mucilaginibacter rubeus]|uniref:LLM class flavin-dependent oxidoreductase n=1 Tax=Mucilaginibacter rubeus TaxID=2027860 RepID=A0AAE6JEX2_9SPHI|nr:MULTISPECIES: Atu2307/SP_0267 family LLM class monooxygenase [Mucilaginibacter]QEM04422.1 LLM class flavin-dependent oxidoreductase [Mucilaginibacter rubeus]QEM17018.1 LLM class flavin-dependent oxidoreductase [Mucilaginibacter gossypii]QTE46485.1 LLM class flavin-dependent oxidoreductase [Mucilaginibacter rubeus]QTE53082.1 LLM class flavin-dependent oxidoreductase [Mucilaginibacter rubeus]QTE58169.1 LLM class flavin-dependent oxidoreductase [Mucilaginibacter rubeus]